MKTEKVQWTISEVAEMINVETFIIRFWEREFYWFEPERNKKGKRKFKKEDIETVKSINLLINGLEMKHNGIRKAHARGYEKDLERIIKDYEKSTN